MGYLVIYFIIGALEDFLATLTSRYIAREKAAHAAIFSFLSTIVTMAVLYTIFSFLEGEKSILAIAVYALGISTGTYWAMKVNPELRNIFKTTRKRKGKHFEIVPVDLVKEAKEKKDKKEIYV
ncbi:MAG: hypothetical protein AAB587_00140 [Patescibacteria group bacterium]